MRIEDFLLPCMNKTLFGVDCYGCGAQRSLLLLLNGKFREAFFMYPAIYPILILLGFLILNLFVNFKKAYQIRIILIIIMGFTMGVSYLIKMSYFFQLTN